MDHHPLLCTSESSLQKLSVVLPPLKKPLQKQEKIWEILQVLYKYTGKTLLKIQLKPGRDVYQLESVPYKIDIPNEVAVLEISLVPKEIIEIERNIKEQ